MASKDFNISMDDYISQRREKKLFSFSRRKDDEEMDDIVPSDINSDSVYVIKKPKTFWQKLAEKFSGVDEEDFQEKEKEEVSVSKEKEQEFEQKNDEIKQNEKRGIFAWFSGIFSTKVNETYEDLDEEEKLEQEVKLEEDKFVENVSIERKGFWNSLLGFFGLGTDDIDDVESKGDDAQQKLDLNELKLEDVKLEEIKKDFKEIAIIATATFKKLPKDQFELFKTSSDFNKFKTILKKHNIIREK